MAARSARWRARADDAGFGATAGFGALGGFGATGVTWSWPSRTAAVDSSSASDSSAGASPTTVTVGATGVAGLPWQAPPVPLAAEPESPAPAADEAGVTPNMAEPSPPESAASPTTGAKPTERTRTATRVARITLTGRSPERWLP